MQRDLKLRYKIIKSVKDKVYFFNFVSEPIKISHLALNLLQSKLEETKVTRNELTQTVRNMLGNDYYCHHVSFIVEYIHQTLSHVCDMYTCMRMSHPWLMNNRRIRNPSSKTRSETKREKSCNHQRIRF